MFSSPALIRRAPAVCAACSIAGQRIAEADLNNISLHNPDHGPEHSLPDQPTFTLVMVNDALHDMTRPDLCLNVRERRVQGGGCSGACDKGARGVGCQWCEQGMQGGCARDLLHTLVVHLRTA